MNQMEAFKWEQKHLESSQKDRERERAAARDLEAEARKALDDQEKAKQDRQRRQEEAKREKELGELEKLVHRQALRAYPKVSTSLTAPPVALSPTPASSTGLTSSTVSASPATSSLNTSMAATNTSRHAQSLATASASSHETLNNSTEAHSIVKAQLNSSESQSVKHTPRGDHSESIYATITRRLNALEGNSSLIARYIEEQSRVMRAALGTLERDWDEWRFGHDAEERVKWEQEVSTHEKSENAHNSACGRKTAWARLYHS